MRFKQYLKEIDDKGSDDKFLQVLNDMQITNYEIRQDGLVDVISVVDKYVQADEARMTAEDGSLYIKFHTVHASMNMSGMHLRNWSGGPQIILGDVCSYRDSNIEFIKYLPDEVHGNLDIANTNIWDLTGLQDKVKFSHSKNTGEMGGLTINPMYIKKGGLGLLLCEGLHNLDLIDDHGNLPALTWHKDHNHRSTQAFLIIGKHLGQPENLFDCQAELIEHGFEEFAEL